MCFNPTFKINRVTCVGQALINFSTFRKSYLFPEYIQPNVFIYSPDSHPNLLGIKDSATLRKEFIHACRTSLGHQRGNHDYS